jgi:hypothetical protein
MPGQRKWFNLYCLTSQAKSRLRFLCCEVNVNQVAFCVFSVLAVLTLFISMFVDMPDCITQAVPVKSLCLRVFCFLPMTGS